MEKPLTKQELADMMGISLSTLQRKLKEVNLIIPRGLISPKQKKVILELLDWVPSEYIVQKRAPPADTK